MYGVFTYIWVVYGGKRRHINLPYIDIEHLGTASFDLGTCFFLKKISFPLRAGSLDAS